jgi:hypothetical protein
MVRNLVKSLVILLWVGVPVASGQQGTANIQGIASDASGGVLPGVTVTVRNQETGAVRSATTDAAGGYRIAALLPGVYEATAELAGFTSMKREGIRLTVGAEATLDFTLSVGALDESVTVRGELPLVETTRSHVATTISQQQITELPLISRDFLSLATLVPGAGRTTSITGRRGLQIGGSDSRYNYTTIIDGGDIDDDVWGSPVQNVVQDSIQEFQVITNRFDAEYGKALEAVVNVVSKSGTNELRGSGWFFGRHESLRALSHFEKLSNQEKPAFAQRRTGGTVGGPIVRDRAHYFGAYEFGDVDQSSVVAIAPASPLSQYNGVFPIGSTSHMLTARVDYQLSPSHKLMARAMYDKSDSVGGFGGTTPWEGGSIFASVSKSLLAQHTWIPGSRTVNDFRFQYRTTDVDNIPHSTAPTESRPSATLGTATWLQEEARHRYQLYNTLYYTLPRHNLKIGGEISFTETAYCPCAGREGSYVFGTDQPFDVNNPATWPTSFFQTFNLRKEPLSNTYFGLFIQDDWRVRDNLTINLGVRWDVDMRVRDNETQNAALARFPQLAGVLEANPGVDLNNIDPRLGFAWTPDSKTVVRGGAGIYHSRSRMFMQAIARDALLTDRFSVLVTDPERLRLYPNVDAILGGSPEEFMLSGPRTITTIGNSGDFEIPYAYNVSFGGARQLGPRTSVNVDAIYSHSLKNFAYRIANLPANYSATCRAGTACAPWPTPGFGRITLNVTNGRTRYHALQVGVNHRTSRLTGQLSYTLSESLLRGANAHYFYPARADRPDLDRGPSLADLRHQLAFSVMGQTVWGVRLGAIVKASSGAPFGITAGVDLDGDSLAGFDRPEGLALNQGGIRSQENLEIINTFRRTRNLSEVTIDQLAKRYPYFELDLRVSRPVPLGGGRQLELLAEAFNVTNRVNFGTPNGNLSSPGFLTVSSAGRPFEMQLGVRIQF